MGWNHHLVFLDVTCCHPTQVPPHGAASETRGWVLPAQTSEPNVGKRGFGSRWSKTAFSHNVTAGEVYVGLVIPRVFTHFLCMLKQATSSNGLPWLRMALTTLSSRIFIGSFVAGTLGWFKLDNSKAVWECLRLRHPTRPEDGWTRIGYRTVGEPRVQPRWWVAAIDGFLQISVKPQVKPPKMQDLSCCSSKRQGLPNVHDSKKARKKSSPDDMFNGKVPILVRKTRSLQVAMGQRSSVFLHLISFWPYVFTNPKRLVKCCTYLFVYLYSCSK